MYKNHPCKLMKTIKTIANIRCPVADTHPLLEAGATHKVTAIAEPAPLELKVKLTPLLLLLPFPLPLLDRAETIAIARPAPLAESEVHPTAAAAAAALALAFAGPCRHHCLDPCKLLEQPAC